MRKLIKVMKVLSVCAAIVVVVIVALYATCLYLANPYDLHGPDSPSGLTVIAHVSDCGVGIGSDFYTDIKVLDGDGRIVAEWRDREGQHPRGGPQLLVQSMKWLDGSTLEFKTQVERVTLRIPEQ